MITKALELNTSIKDINPEIGAMAKEILEPYTVEVVKYKASEVATIFTWCKEIIGKLEAQGQIASLPNEPADPNERINFRIEKENKIFGIKKIEKGGWK